ncbi:MAG: HAD hydrolase family protein [Nitrospirota bacterium]|jgi:soluble P-type ATPase
MLRVDIPGYGRLELDHYVTDFSGTLSEEGRLMPGVREKLNELSGSLTIHVLTSDTFGRALRELDGVACIPHVLGGEGHTGLKRAYVEKLGADKVVSVGNGNNDVEMLRASRLGIAVCLAEGCSTEAAGAADILVTSAVDAIDLLLNTKRLIATLRR